MTFFGQGPNKKCVFKGSRSQVETNEEPNGSNWVGCTVAGVPMPPPLGDFIVAVLGALAVGEMGGESHRRSG
jgi:hypothetical protein